ncbi:hypothetical protein ACIQWA_24505 [Kitasatospora sp. NPDC098652]|uniref:hypothetical protein n=1 Tax=Kitasatospora sp. NPDC098652 TaxID=3364095 RepID=UPI00380E09FF
MPITALARSGAVTPGAAAAPKAAQGAHQGVGFVPPRARGCGLRRPDGGCPPAVRPAVGVGRTVGSATVVGVGAGLGASTGAGAGAGAAAVRMLFGLPARQFAQPLAALYADASVIGLGDTWLDALVTVVVTLVLALVSAVVRALVELPVGRVEVGAGAVPPGPCARTAGRVRFDRSGRLKTSHGSRLFKGEGPTGEEDNAARAAGPPTG